MLSEEVTFRLFLLLVLIANHIATPFGLRAHGPPQLKKLRQDDRPDDAHKRPIRLPAGRGSPICHQRASEIASVKHPPTWDQARRERLLRRTQRQGDVISMSHRPGLGLEPIHLLLSWRARGLHTMMLSECLRRLVTMRSACYFQAR